MTISSAINQGFQLLRFFGKTTASLSHELNNVLAIINELNGLLDDFLCAAKSGQPLDPVRLKSVTDRIARQIERGKQYVKLLNRFAHTVDTPVKEFDARETMSDIVAVCTRMTTLKKIDLLSELPDEPIPIEANQFDLAHIVHHCIELTTSLLEPKSSITVRMEKSEPGFSIAILGCGNKENGTDFLATVTDIRNKVEQLGGRLDETKSTDDHPVQLTLHFPLKFSINR